MNKSPHILTTSSNLLGFAFLVLTSIKSFGLPQKGFVDELIALLIVFLATSTSLSFASIRSRNEARSARFETIADYLFLVGLLLTTVISVLLGVDVLLFST